MSNVDCRTNYSMGQSLRRLSLFKIDGFCHSCISWNLSYARRKANGGTNHQFLWVVRELEETKLLVKFEDETADR